jgi:putative membrane protein
VKTEPYTQFENNALILRDYLAADRTALANKRTLLAYVCTALTLAATGAALIHFFGSAVVEVVGWVLVVLAIGILAMGGQSYLRMRERLAKIVDTPATRDMS